jgi:hypothetical protein
MVSEMRYVLGQHALEMAAVKDQYSVQQLAADGPIQRSAIAFARGARTGVRRMGMASLVNTASNTPVNLLSRSRIKNVNSSRAVAEVHQKVPCLLGDPGAVRVRCDAQEVDAAGGVLDDEQNAQPVKYQPGK